ncbi:MAG TPA: metallophosphoesterase [Ignavibacteria bacterium]|nr:metallophosphoesterase [Bacteroidota bacterium]HRE12162.1 metallophosphoesterase [Ignavibacteria bacterium]HRF65758.1 metallophosphoesterase [Ignavibacteria bacterium]HRJ03211.1 metallophosphoesterase [Ignavibacteria bacterium]HRJ86942.1 metallophosphoesterase [Ignavibacteria bacterium]
MKTTAFITDIHFAEDDVSGLGVNQEKNWRIILDDITQRGDIDEIIFGGDIGSAAAHDMFFASLNNCGIGYKVILGNHDTFEDVRKHIQTVSESDNELFYSYDDAGFRYIFLDTSTSSFSTDQLNRLKEKIVTELPITIFIHHPVLRVDSIVDKLYSLKGRDEIKSLLRSAKNEITIFCGHLHNEDTAEEGNIRQYLTPSASYQALKHTEDIITDINEFGYRIIKFGKEIHTEIIKFEKS